MKLSEAQAAALTQVANRAQRGPAQAQLDLLKSGYSKMPKGGRVKLTERKRVEATARDNFRDAIKPLASTRQRRAWEYVQRLEEELTRARAVVATAATDDVLSANAAWQLANEYLER